MSNKRNVTLTDEQLTTINNALIAYLERLEFSEQQMPDSPSPLTSISRERGITIQLLDKLDQLESIEDDRRQHSYLPGTSYDY